MTDRHGKFFAVLVALLASFSTMPLFQPYFFASSDGLFHLYRLMEYDTVIRDGVLYPRWAPDFFYGFGMPLFNYYAPLTYYLADVFHLLGAGYIDSLRLFVALAMGLSGIGAYLYARTFLPPLSSLLAAVVYMYVPYHLVNLYYRGDLAEYAAYTWFPFILWAINRLLERKSPVYLFAGTLFYAALILTHNLSAFIFSGFLIIYGLAALVREYLLDRKSRPILAMNVLRLGALAVLAWGITAFFWLPALAEKSLMNFDRLLFHYSFYKYFPTLDELLSTDIIHRYGVVFRSAEVYGYKLGALQAVFLIVGTALFIWQRDRLITGLRIEVIASVLVTAIALFLIFPVSLWVWENAPLLNLTQFPWRFLAFIALPSALIAGFAVQMLPGRARWAAVIVLVPIVILSSTAAMSPIMSNVKEADVSPKGSMEFELTYGAIGTSAAAEYLPVWVKERPATSPIALAAVTGESFPQMVGRTGPGMDAVQVEKRADRATYRVHSEKEGIFIPNVLSFPGWVAYLDEQQIDTTIDDKTGLIQIAVPQGDHTISLQFIETPLRKTSDMISELTLLLLMGLIFGPKRGRRLREIGLSMPALSKENLVKLGIVVVLIPVWLFAKSFYDSAYSPPKIDHSPLVVNMDNQVLIEGYDISATQLRPDSSIQVSIFWRLLANDAQKRYKPFIRLTNSFNQTWAYAEAPDEYSVANAKQDGINVTNLDLKVLPGTPPGIYQIEVAFEEVTSKQLLDVRRVQVVPILPSEKGARIGPVIVGRSDKSNAPTASPSNAASLPEPVNFGDNLRLADLAITNGEALVSGKFGAPLAKSSEANSWQVKAGEAVHLDLLWQALDKLDGNLTVTARLSSADRTLWAVRDSQPADGAYPTSLWMKGENVRDQLNLKVPPETPPGQYELELEVVSNSGPLSILDRNRIPIGPTLRLGKLGVTQSAKLADRDDVTVQRRVNASLLDGLSVFGYGLGRPELQPGEQLSVDVAWQATKTISTDLIARLELVDKSGNSWASVSRRPVGDAYPTTFWRKGEILRGKYSLLVKASAPEGEADLRIQMVDASGGQILVSVNLDRVRILPRTRSFSASPSKPLVKAFDDRIRLLGYDLTSDSQPSPEQMPQAAASGSLKVNLYWQAVKEMSTSYTMFVQVLNSDGRLVAQHDALPQGGKVPTTAWAPNEVVADEHAVQIPGDIADGDYTVITGIYDVLTSKRLSVEGGGDFVVVAPLHISKETKK